MSVYPSLEFVSGQPVTHQERGTDSLVARMRAEYHEMPGLSLTRAQACRLWSLDAATCQKALDHLVSSGVLTTSGQGCYMVPSAAA